MAIVLAVLAGDGRQQSLLDRVLRVSYKWPINEVFVDGSRLLPCELCGVEGVNILVVHHAGSGVVEERDGGLTARLEPSKILGLPGLEASPFASRVTLYGDRVEIHAGPPGSPPIAYLRGVGIVAVSCPPSVMGTTGWAVVQPHHRLLVSFSFLKMESPQAMHEEPFRPATISEAALWLSDELLNAVSSTASKRCAILFSGGLDSSALAAAAVSLGLNPLAVSVGLARSHDLECADRAARLLGLDHVAVELGGEEALEVRSYLARNVSLDSVMDEALSILFYVGTCRAVAEGRRQILSGQGADELFGGYSRYIRLAAQSSLAEAEEEMRSDLAGLWMRGVPRDYASAALAGGLITMPYLHERIVSKAYKIPAEFKISMGVGKTVLREAGRILGLPAEIAWRAKKAAQYGSGLEKFIRRVKR